MKSRTKLFLALALCATVVLSTAGCESAPKGAIPVSDFDVTSYLGKWYEIARLDFSHEKNMSNVTAEYTLNDDGTIRVKKQRLRLCRRRMEGIYWESKICWRH